MAKPSVAVAPSEGRVGREPPFPPPRTPPAVALGLCEWNLLDEGSTVFLPYQRVFKAQHVGKGDG